MRASRTPFIYILFHMCGQRMLIRKLDRTNQRRKLAQIFAHTLVDAIQCYAQTRCTFRAPGSSHQPRSAHKWRTAHYCDLSALAILDQMPNGVNKACRETQRTVAHLLVTNVRLGMHKVMVSWCALKAVSYCDLSARSILEQSVPLDVSQDALSNASSCVSGRPMVMSISTAAVLTRPCGGMGGWEA